LRNRRGKKGQRRKSEVASISRTRVPSVGGKGAFGYFWREGGGLVGYAQKQQREGVCKGKEGPKPKNYRKVTSEGLTARKHVFEGVEKRLNLRGLSSRGFPIVFR